jgi:hypothetical protein
MLKKTKCCADLPLPAVAAVLTVAASPDSRSWRAVEAHRRHTPLDGGGTSPELRVLCPSLEASPRNVSISCALTWFGRCLRVKA